MRPRLWIPLAILLSFLGLAGSLWYTYPWQGVNTDFAFSFFTLPEPIQLDDKAKEFGVRVVHEALKNPAQPDTPGDPPRDAPEVYTLRDTREVWVSLYLPERPRLLGMAAEASLYRSLQRAARQALSTAKEQSYWQEHLSEVAIQIDILQARVPLRSVRDGYLFFALEPGIDGLIVTRRDKIHYQLPSDVLTRGLLTPRKDSRKKCYTAMLDQACRDLGTRRRAWQEDPELKIERFRTLSFGEPVPGKGVRSFYRANVLLEQKDVTSDRIYQSIKEGAQWLLDNAKPDGRFNYEYIPHQDTYPGTYNAVRHAGTVYGLLELYRHFGEQSFLDAAKKAAPYLYANIKRPGKEEEFLALPDGKTWPTGAAALGLLAFVNMPPDLRTADFKRYCDGLGNFLLRMIDDRGSVFEGYRAAKGANRVVKEPLYYPGESMLALSKLYEIDKNPKWLEGAERIAEYQIGQFRRGLMADHWVMQGLYQLYRHTRNEHYARAALEMGDSYIETQCPPNDPPFADYFGAWRRDTETPRTTRAGSRSEALTAVVRLAWETGADATPYENSLLYAAEHQIEQQFRPESAWFVPRPSRVLGGYRAGLIDNHLRIDFNQHSAVGLIGALEVAVKRENRQPFWKELSLEEVSRLPSKDPLVLPDPTEPESGTPSDAAEQKTEEAQPAEDPNTQRKSPTTPATPAPAP